MRSMRMVWFVLAQFLLGVLPHPRWRAWTLRRLGAEVGHGVRVHACRFINHELGFSNLRIGHGVYIGADSLLDLAGPLHIDDRATISARCILMTHADPGVSHGNSLAAKFPPSYQGCRIGADAWIGVGAILLQGSDVGERSMVGAASLVLGALPSDHVCHGQPAKPVRSLR
jgi:putative colanic acid biosynthesis acetyltransferase WcaF